MYTEILSKIVITKIHSVSTMYNESGKKAKRINRPNWAIVIKYEGETVYKISDKQYVSNINNMVILPKGSTYETHFMKSGHFSIIEFECAEEYHSPLFFSLRNSDKILELFRKMEYKRNIRSPLYELECIQNTYAIINMLYKESTRKYSPDHQHQRLAPALDYIAKNYTNKITNAELASLTGLSTDYFRKFFARVYGVSPIEYINDLKIKRAKEMLKSDYISITDIAFSLGYENIYDFSRCFKKATGISPSRYYKK